MSDIGKTVRMFFESNLCPSCRQGPVPYEARFCPFCGNKLPDMSIVDSEYRSQVGFWLVSTEDSKNDGNWTILGVYEGNIVDLARRLMGFSTRTLQFKAVPKPSYKQDTDARNSVDISFPASTNLARTDRSSRARIMRSLIDFYGMQGVDVMESPEYGSVKLVFSSPSADTPNADA